MGDLALGISAQEFRKRFENASEDELENFLDSLVFKPMSLLIRTQEDNYGGNTRTRYFAQKLLQRNVVNETKSLLHRMSIYQAMPSKHDANKNDEADFDEFY